MREGRVVERDGRAVVRFGAPGCQGSGPCACVAVAREPEVGLTALGLAGEAAAGQRVSVGISRAALDRLAGALFGLPLLALIGGAWLGGALAPADGLAADIIPAAAGLTAAVLVLTLVARRSAMRVASLGVTAQLQRTD